MLTAIKRFFDQHISDSGAGGRPTEHGLHLACAALLFEVSRVDFSVDEVELGALAKALEKKFALSGTQVQELIELAREEIRQSTSYHEFTNLINNSFQYEQKVQLVEMMWRVAYADQHLDRYEEHLVRKVAELLYVSHVDFIQAKHRALQG